MSAVAVKLLRDCVDARNEIAAYEQLRRYEAHPHVLDICFGLGDGCVRAQHTCTTERR